MKTEFIKALRTPLFEALVGEVAATRDDATKRTQAYLDKVYTKTIKSIVDTMNKTLSKKEPPKKKEYVSDTTFRLILEAKQFPIGFEEAKIRSKDNRKLIRQDWRRYVITTICEGRW